MWHLDKFENIQAFSVWEEEAREEQKLHLFFNLEQKRHEEDNELQLFTSGVITFWPISDYSQPLRKTQDTTLERPTSTSKLQVFLKIKCHINCSIYVCLNHLTCIKLGYFVLGSYDLYVPLRKTLRSVTLHSERPFGFFCDIREYICHVIAKLALTGAWERDLKYRCRFGSHKHINSNRSRGLNEIAPQKWTENKKVEGGGRTNSENTDIVATGREIGDYQEDWRCRKPERGRISYVMS